MFQDQQSLSYNETICPYTIFPYISHLWIDIPFLLLVITIACLILFGIGVLIFMCCRTCDKCMARHQLFHHKRAFISTKTYQQPPLNISSPIFPQTNPFYSYQPMQPSRIPRTRRTTFVHFPDQDPSVTASNSRVVTNVDKLEQTLGIPLSDMQKENIKRVLMEPTGIENTNFYDVPPPEPASTSSDSTFDNDPDLIQVEVLPEPPEVPQQDQALVHPLPVQPPTHKKPETLGKPVR